MLYKHLTIYLFYVMYYVALATQPWLHSTSFPWWQRLWTNSLRPHQERYRQTIKYKAASDSSYVRLMRSAPSRHVDRASNQPRSLALTPVGVS